jgi:hypothetical protein
VLVVTGVFIAAFLLKEKAAFRFRSLSLLGLLSVPGRKMRLYSHHEHFVKAAEVETILSIPGNTAAYGILSHLPASKSRTSIFETNRTARFIDFRQYMG